VKCGAKGKLRGRLGERWKGDGGLWNSEGGSRARQRAYGITVIANVAVWDP